MKNKVFREYLSINQQVNHWGITIHNAGYSEILPGETYPGKEHPNEYYFTWERGRKLRNYQLILITNGEGVFESESAKKQKVRAGSVILLFKNEWHRYRPLKKTGWTEYWLGYDGDHIERIYGNALFVIEKPVIYIGEDTHFAQLMIHNLSLLEENSPGNEKIVASYVPVLLSTIETIIRHKSLGNSRTEKIVNKFQITLLENFQNNLVISDTAACMDISYSWLRREFKKYVGISPNKYVLQLRLQKARDLLISGNRQVKYIANECGFASSFYFSKYFKEDTGLSPTEFRDKHKNFS